MNYYKHQKYLIIFIILFGLLKDLVKLFSKDNLKGNFMDVILLLFLQIMRDFFDCFIIGIIKI